VASQVYLSGGPCDGKTVSADDIQGGLVGYIACGGGYYTLDSKGKRHDGHAVFDYAGKNKPEPPGGNTAKAPHAHNGWSDLQRSVNRHWPKTLSRMAKLQRESLRSLHKVHRVKG
jgi:hypothetical protein